MQRDGGEVKQQGRGAEQVNWVLGEEELKTLERKIMV